MKNKTISVTTGTFLPKLVVNYFNEKVKCYFCKNKYKRYDIDFHMKVMHMDEIFSHTGGVLKIPKLI